MSEHKQVCVKVNAYVDEKIAPVIEAMSLLEDVVTFTSCEDEIDDGFSSIYFFYRDEHQNWRGIGEICETISKALEYFEYAKISVCWQPGAASCPKGHLKFEKRDASDLARRIRSILRNES